MTDLAGVARIADRGAAEFAPPWFAGAGLDVVVSTSSSRKWLHYLLIGEVAHDGGDDVGDDIRCGRSYERELSDCIRADVCTPAIGIWQ